MATPAARQSLSMILEMVPKVSYAVAYGSAVIKQEGYAGSNMVDYIFAVDDATEWHRENLRMNGYRHYSALGAVGPRALSSIQSLGAGVYFNVPRLEQGEAKYALIEVPRLCSELRRWDNLYISGRLHKPVATLVPHEGIAEANEVNLRSALCAALLLLPDRFTDSQLFATVSSLSYMGDPRMRGVEHPDKPKMIAGGQEKAFAELYEGPIRGLLRDAGGAGGAGGRGFEQDGSAAARAALYAELPDSVILISARKMGLPPTGGGGGGEEREAVRDAVEKDPGIARGLLEHSISSIVAPAARVQMLKGLCSFGLSTAGGYISHKLRRFWSSR